MTIFELTRYYLFVFGALTIAGGILGFVKAKSRASLIAGGISGVLLLVAAVLTASSPLAGLALALVISLALAGRFIPSYIDSKKFMPAGMMSILSALGLVLVVVALIQVV